MRIKTWTKTILVASALFLAAPATFRAANHREAPITALDHKADITDVFAFVSYDGERQGRQRPRKRPPTRHQAAFSSHGGGSLDPRSAD